MTNQMLPILDIRWLKLYLITENCSITLYPIYIARNAFKGTFEYPGSIVVLNR